MIFAGRTPNFGKLKAFGFRKEGKNFLYATTICNGQFRLEIAVTERGEAEARLIDEFGEPYTLHLVEEAQGEFVGRVREEYSAVLERIGALCYEPGVFYGEYARKLIVYVREKYGAELEFLWEKFPDCAIWRRQDNGKWYGALLTAERAKIGMKGEGKATVLNVRAEPEEIPLLLGGAVFPGWHMNKRHWISLALDGSAPFEELAERLEESYYIAGRR